MGRFFFLFLVLSCSKPARNEPVALPFADKALQEKRELYVSLLPTVRDVDGFVEWRECDSVHWTALVGAATGPFNIRAVIDDEGKLHRRPQRHGECYPKNSKSENSRDAFLMVLAYGLATRDLDLIDGIFRYGKAHNWVMGKGPLSRTFFTLNMRSLYARAVQHLGGKKHQERLLPMAWPSGQTGYAAHLQIVSILVDAKIEGGITEQGLKRILEHAQREPKNSLYVAALSRFDSQYAPIATGLLLSEAWWPKDRLPTSADRCEPWLTQRDDGESWLPCEDGHTHSGGDYLFAEAVLSGHF